MELDNLKYVWKRIEEDPSSMQNEDQIRRMLDGKPTGPLSRMKRNLRIESALAIGLYLPLSVWYWFDFNGKLPEVSAFLLLVLVLFIAYYFRKNRLLSDIQRLSWPVKENLERHIDTLEKYLRFYLILGLLIPGSILFLGLLMYAKLPHPLGPNIFYVGPGHPLWGVALIWVGILLFASLFIYFADRWYVNKLYVDHIRKLKEMLRELNDQ